MSGKVDIDDLDKLPQKNFFEKFVEDRLERSFSFPLSLSLVLESMPRSKVS